MKAEDKRTQPTMMGVIADLAEECDVREFFELFKVPWEFYRSDRHYEVVLCAGDAKLDSVAAKVLLLYSGKRISFDTGRLVYLNPTRVGVAPLSKNQPRIYGNSVTFRHTSIRVLADEGDEESIAYFDRLGSSLFVRIGYDLFREIHILLTNGQPASSASVPTLELHIALLRALIVGCGIPVVEIPPVPDGYPFVACLTHDVDHPSISRHKWDHTAFGFLYRAIVGSPINVLRGRAPLRDLLANWGAALKLPLVYLGLLGDFWYEFDRYREIEMGKPSTFFILPFKNNPGRSIRGQAPRGRSSCYEASDIADKIRVLMSSGSEIGLHGIDAWLDSSSGHEELEQIRQITNTPDIGVRMHWLYMSEESAVNLEKAGANYDSTVGYNETVGYRAGTGQVYKPPQATRLLELPLHVMDTALFYPSRLNLSPKKARIIVGRIVDNAVQFGGCLTINWHDRSIAPERLWGDFYGCLLDDLKTRGAWFSSGDQAVSWFRKRRSAFFETVYCESGALRAKVSVPLRDELPGLRLRIHKPHVTLGFTAPSSYFDIAFNDDVDTSVLL